MKYFQQIGHNNGLVKSTKALLSMQKPDNCVVVHSLFRLDLETLLK